MKISEWCEKKNQEELTRMRKLLAARKSAKESADKH